MEIGFVVVLVAFIAICIRLVAGSTDRGRIASYIEQKGGRVVSISWAPFGRGWFGEKNARIYEVVYYDTDGRQHMATCKTSMFGGVYWTEDRISHSRPSWHNSISPSNEPGNPIIRRITPPVGETGNSEEITQLRNENARLRDELEGLNRERKNGF